MYTSHVSTYLNDDRLIRSGIRKHLEHGKHTTYITCMGMFVQQTVRKQGSRLASPCRAWGMNEQAHIAENVKIRKRFSLLDCPEPATIEHDTLSGRATQCSRNEVMQRRPTLASLSPPQPHGQTGVDAMARFRHTMMQGWHDDTRVPDGTVQHQ